MFRKEAASGGNALFDPYRRRDCRPKILWSVGGASVDDNGAAAGEGKAPETNGPKGGEENEAAAATNGTIEADRQQDVPSLQKMHSFGGVDILEAGKAALEARIAAKQTPAVQREGGKLTLGTYLEKARFPTFSGDHDK